MKTPDCAVYGRACKWRAAGRAANGRIAIRPALFDSEAGDDLSKINDRMLLIAAFEERTLLTFTAPLRGSAHG
jgi:hypothetical protein